VLVLTSVEQDAWGTNLDRGDTFRAAGLVPPIRHLLTSHVAIS
jgi:hypothetical protein